MNRIDPATILEDETVRLLPMQQEHFAELETIARDARIWEFYPYDCMDPSRFRQLLEAALAEREKGTQFPFVIFHKKDNKLAGSTRFLDLQLQHDKLEIGWTWLQHNYWASEINAACKLLLLTFCFEQLLLKRVCFRTDENNMRSRKAIEKTGAKFEGILRNDIRRDNGTYRSTAYFSILDHEWEMSKAKLTELYFHKKNNHERTSL